MELRDLYPDMPALLAAIRQRPGMFLGHKSISGLHLLIPESNFAEDFHGLSDEVRLGGVDFTGFERWVESRYNPQRLSHNSFSLAASLAESEAAGFDLWFGWYDEFLNRKKGRTGKRDIHQL